MDEQLLTALAEACAPFGDGRFHVCELTIVPGDGRFGLEGRVLDEATLAAVLDDLGQRAPGVRWEAEGVRVLRGPAARPMTVATNLTGLQRQPSWLGEHADPFPDDPFDGLTYDDAGRVHVPDRPGIGVVRR